ncbi:interferon-induced, double-stranded RNA-activated protein kinase-like isoform X2 [Garra rufa]|uniref:interferon-induced, double-stranded RNA-activated protein kinase-like isoform X2 n=1 Tax=Garra rufa TaxID=137080 RepID=UPI003CCEB268
MSADTEMERKICDFLRRNGKSNALDIAKELKLDKRTVNKHLYDLEKSNQLFKTDEVPPIWDFIEKKSELKLTPKPERTSQMTTEEKQVEDLLRSGGLKASDIAKDLGLPRKTINKQLYSMEEKGKVKKCIKLWRLNDESSDDSFSQNSSSSCPSDQGLVSVSGLSHSFDVIAELGQGGYGCVYKVKHKYDGKIYAVKRVILTRKADSEVKALARLDHPNIVRYITCWPGSDDWTSDQESNQVFNKPGSLSDVVTFERSGSGDNDDDQDDVTSRMESLGVTESASAAEPPENNGTDGLDSSNHRTYLFIQMEFCMGGTLTNWIKARNLKEKQRITVEIHQVFYEIITGVEYIHANKLIHRDLKPDNILFGADGKVKIGDFGLVAAQSDQNGDPMERSNKGTQIYMSPEQKNKKNYDEKTDIFPLGLVWFEMIWKISTLSERVKLWPDLRDRRFPKGFSDSYQTESKFIMKMLSYSPEDRPHAKDTKETLEKFFSLHQNMLSQKTV